MFNVSNTIDCGFLSIGSFGVATWNVAHLGLHKRTDADHALIAEILRWFDLVAVQETNDNLTGLRAVLSNRPKKHRTVFSDATGNNERMAFVYATKLTVGDEIGKVAPAPADYRHTFAFLG